MAFISINSVLSTRLRALAATAALVVSGLFAVVLATAAPAAADPAPVAQIPTNAATATALPTVQIDGVVWAEAMAGNTVYAAGKFGTARPAGAAAGSQTTVRNNFLSFDVTTGALNTSFAPSLSSQALAVAVSPDGSRVYVSGDFITANSVTRNHIAAYSTATGQLISSFAPNVDGEVRSIAVTNTTVYMGGTFGHVNNVPRTRLAAVNASDGSLTAWAPTSDAQVDAMVMTPDNSRVIVGGAFDTINGATVLGLGAIDASTGTSLPWATNQLIQDYSSSAAILSLTTDGKNIFGTGYTYGPGNFEGTFSADPDSGTLNWMEDCHGDTYGVYAGAGAVYVVSHEHFCANIGSFPDTNPRNVWYRGTAFSTNATGTLLHNSEGGYTDWGGQPSPTQYNWYPNLAAGSYTGDTQAAWSVTGNDKYVVMGGEFPSVNGTAQQGLVRFAVPSVQPDKLGPAIGGTALTPTATALSNGTVRIAWQSDYDLDDLNLTYKLIRSDKYPNPVYTVVSPSEVWNRPNIGYLDKTVTPGKTYSYYLKVSDAAGNTASSGSVSITVPTSSTPDSTYAKDVAAAGATDYWRLDEAAGATTDYDHMGFNDLTLNSSFTPGAAGAIGGDTDSATTFDGSSGFAATGTAISGPNTFTEQAWFSTTSTSGGKIIGFGDQKTGNSSNYDRHVYMDAAGHINFGVYNNAAYLITSPKTYNDGQYHQVTASLSSAGMSLYIDGRLIGTNAGTTVGQPYSGYWRIGGDSSWSGNNYFAGTIDDVAIYPSVLTQTQIRQQYTDSGRTIPGSTAPTDAYGKAVYNDSPALYYRLDDSNSTAADASGNSNDGTYYGNVMQGVPSNVAGTDTAATFDGSSSTVSSNTQIVAPTVYSVEAWFNTTSTSGGKIIGFGDQQNGNSNNYDRHVYMLANGQVVFGTYTGQLNLATSPTSYNDGTWHHVVGTQGPDGMTLYMDGHAVATNPQTSAQGGYSGYWRIGGDNLNGWGADGQYFAGAIDEAAAYLTELSPSQVLAHYKASSAAVNPAPTASFTASPTGTTVAFDASASSDANGTITSYTWDFGDGSSGTGVAPSHTYAASGAYNVKLTVKDSFGATGSSTQGVAVTAPNQPPVAAFTSNATNLSVAFDGTGSSDPDGTVASYAWDFGDGGASTSATPTHVFASAGSYTVKLTVTDNSGATNSVSHVLTVVAANQPPVAAFTSNATNLSVAFDGTGSSDPDGTVASYLWDFGDGGSSTSSKPTHAYASAGSYNVQLTVTDNAGATNSVSHSVTATVPANQPPVAAFTSNATNLSVAFDGTGSSDPDGTVASYAWDFGDSASSTSSKPTHVYGSAGSYTVKLTVTDNSGATNSVSHTVTVAAANQPPVAAFTSNATNLSVAFDGTGSSDPDGTVASYAWDFGDSASSTSSKPTHVYGSAGSYTVKLTVTDNSGATNSVSHTVTVAAANQPPVAAFTSNATNLSVAFDGTGSSDPDGTVASYAWDFGDSASSTSSKPTHVYGSAGSYTVKLTVTDNSGATNSVSHTVTVAAANQPPVAAFTSNATNLSVAFDGTGSSDPDGTVASYAWDFGDSASSTSSKPTHVYGSAGSYTVKLTVTDNSGATNSVTHSVTVSNQIAADTFSRTGSGKWGTADTGGAWTISSGASNFSTDGSVGKVNLNAAGVGYTAMLNSISATNINAVIDVSTDKAGTGGGVYLTLAARHSGTSEYRLKLRLLPGGVVHLLVTKLVSGTETSITEVTVSGLTYNAGDTLRLRFGVNGDGSTTTITGKVWKVGTTEPTANQVSTTDTTASLQSGGSFGVEPYLSGSATNAPVAATFDNLSILQN